LRGTPHRARAEEWEKITGDSETSIAWAMVSAETWERSTMIPSRFISRTTSSPNRVNPPCSGSSVAESAHGVLWLWVSVMYAAPSRASIRSAPRDDPMDCPPSTPTMDATRPSAAARSTSAAVRASANVSG